jgi:hypothetical protein
MKVKIVYEASSGKGEFEAGTAINKYIAENFPGIDIIIRAKYKHKEEICFCPNCQGEGNVDFEMDECPDCSENNILLRGTRKEIMIKLAKALKSLEDK